MRTLRDGTPRPGRPSARRWPAGAGRRPALGGDRRLGHPAAQGYLGGPREVGRPHPAADLAEIVRTYAIRRWIEQSYQQVRDQLGWADFQVRSDTASRRRPALVKRAFCLAGPPGSPITRPQVLQSLTHPRTLRLLTRPRILPSLTRPRILRLRDQDRRRREDLPRRRTAASTVPAPCAACAVRAWLPLDRAEALVYGVVQGAPAPETCKPWINRTETPSTVGLIQISPATPSVSSDA